MTSMEPGFNHDVLKHRLNGLSTQRRLVFAVSCYFAVEHHYRAFVDDTGWGDAERMRAWAVRLWNSAVGHTPLDRQAVDVIQTQWDELVPDHDEFDSPLTSVALDAAVTLMCATVVAESGSVEEASNAGYQAVAIADLLAQEAEDMHPQDPQLEEKILAHGLMQSELRRQEQLLAVLESGVEFTADSLGLRDIPNAH